MAWFQINKAPPPDALTAVRHRAWIVRGVVFAFVLGAGAGVAALLRLNDVGLELFLVSAVAAVVAEEWVFWRARRTTGAR